MRGTTGFRLAVLVTAIVLVTLACFSSPVSAQVADPNRGRITFIGGFDVATAYMFRGLLQDDTRVVLWPYTEATVDLFAGSGGDIHE